MRSASAIASVIGMVLDPEGVCGCLLHYALIFMLVGGAIITFFYLWHKGKLDMDEAPKFQMLQDKEFDNDRN